MQTSSLLRSFTADSEECKKLELALEGSKAILEHVDKAVQRYEDHLRLVDMQKKLDKKAIEAATSGPLAEYRVRVRWNVGLEIWSDLKITILLFSSPGF